MTTDVLRAKVEISELAAKYGYYCDRFDWEQVVALYTADGVFDAESLYGKVVTGHADLRTFYESLPQAVAHHPSSLFTTVHDDGTATTAMKMLVLFGRQLFSVDYDWELAEVDGTWLIRRQTISLQGKVSLRESATA